jgi:glyoxylase I family protein
VIVVETLHHVSISVVDLERARRFYQVILGLREIDRPPFDFPGAWYAVGDRQLHLIVHPGTRTLRKTTSIDARGSHFALRAQNYPEAVRHLQQHGVDCRARPENLTGWPQLYVTDPDGNVIELNFAPADL